MKLIHELFDQITNLGGSVFYLFNVSLLFLMGFKRESIYLFIILILTYLIILIIRQFYFVNRPTKRKFKNFIEKIDASSFPSHHAMKITIISLAMINFFPQIISIIFFISLIILVCYSRLYLKHHRLKDVIAGSLIGIIIHILIFNLII